MLLVYRSNASLYFLPSSREAAFLAISIAGVVKSTYIFGGTRLDEKINLNVLQVLLCCAETPRCFCHFLMEPTNPSYLSCRSLMDFSVLEIFFCKSSISF